MRRRRGWSTWFAARRTDDRSATSISSGCSAAPGTCEDDGVLGCQGDGGRGRAVVVDLGCAPVLTDTDAPAERRLRDLETDGRADRWCHAFAHRHGQRTTEGAHDVDGDGGVEPAGPAGRTADVLLVHPH